uniref:Uncharacterized protein n=1 Tax=Candidatus Kentrum sp. FM TaxID=2126340 RepID=A0A450RXG1_9GAMM|nr:MAG: hypothetical protein BECKFM1743A_GA0114220_1000332 [Candidatus Kentron sp. FM]VFJ43705.1 MAG: hypothetical protein BECKFM1743C_GA0114222_1000332 [Candidatus Kentron sp. FM]VFK05692.1 MAG: hypothetical protein BECKFM1743B_GA0114221_1000332 [Candidatus Kentron sp. FM]
MNNISRFNECTGKILAKLYEEFPIKTDLEYKEWLKEDENLNDKNTQEFCRATIEWLEESGYIIVYGKYYYDMANKVILTQKGLEALRAIPESLEEGQKRRNIGEALVAAMKEKAPGATEWAVEQLSSRLFTESLKLFGI